MTDDTKTAQVDPARCKRCGWPLAATREEGCVEGDCSYRCHCSPSGHSDRCPVKAVPSDPGIDPEAQRGGGEVTKQGAQMATKKTTLKPIIICAGEHGRAVVFGYVTRAPVAGKPVRLTRARMVLRWDAACGGLFGLAAKGPKADTRITHAVDSTTVTVWREILTVSPEAAEAIESWPSA